MPHHLGDLTVSSETAIVTGDPDRVLRLASAIGTVRDSWARRGFVVAEAETASASVLVCSTGIGGPSLAIVVEELAELGVGCVVRIGTCGSLQPGVSAGDFVLPVGSVRDDGTSSQYLPLTFPAVANVALLTAIASALRATGRPCHMGVTHSKDAYYAEIADRMPTANFWRQRWKEMRAAGVLATEMEVSTLYVVAAVRRLRAAAVLVPVDSSIDAEEVLAALEVAAVGAIDGAFTRDHHSTPEPR